MFCTTHKSKIKAVLDAVNMEKTDKLIDLGCGDGRFIKAAVKRYGLSGTGYEVNPFARVIARFRTAGVKGAEISGKNFWDVSFNDADFIFCYLFPDIMARLAEKASSEMKEGARLISCNFELPGWIPERVIRSGDSNNDDPIFVYKK